MSCEWGGHQGAQDHHIQPQYRCLYCGSWGYDSHWWDDDKRSYEDCDCDYEYHEHFEKCEDE